MTSSPSWLDTVESVDNRRSLAVPGSAEETLKFCVDHFFHNANEAINDHGYFAVALSGGSTPKAIFQMLAKPENRLRADWNKFLLFWSDERSVPPTSTESNYHMAMEAGWKELPVPKECIFRMVAESDLEKNAGAYEELIQTKIPQQRFDLVMLGMGDDGHTASLFPYTHALHVDNKLVTANYVPEKQTWRMTLTFPCINDAQHTVVYVMGGGKEQVLKEVLKGEYRPDQFPSQRVGSPAHRALWIVDDKAARLLKGH